MKQLTGLKRGEDQIVVSTQVIEAGMDISASLLLTDVAPYSSLVQRFGRVNRQGEDPESEIFWVDRPLTDRRKGWAQATELKPKETEEVSAPYEPDLDKLKADFAVLGVPFDEGTWGQPGERYGPRDLRENSQEYAHDLTEGFYYIDGDRTLLKGKHWVDVGDVVIYPTVVEETDAKITDAVRKILARKAFPIILGGDHSITFPVVRSYDIPLTIVHIDAHLDTWNGAKGNLDHASWVLRVAKLPTVKNITQIGMRGIANDPEAAGNAKALHTKVVTSEEIHRHGIAAALEQIPQSENIM